jgi:hypothetical protein
MTWPCWAISRRWPRAGSLSTTSLPADLRGQTLPVSLGVIGGSSMSRTSQSPGVGSICLPVRHTRSRARRLPTAGAR